MDLTSIRHSLRANFDEDAVSPVIGTILMVAVTVALAATVLTVMNSFGDSTPSDSSNAVFKVQGLDTNGDSTTDAIKLTYISGPSGLPNGDVAIQIVKATATTNMTTTTSLYPDWTPGAFRVYDCAATPACDAPTGSSGTWLVTVSVLGSTIVDTKVTLDA